MKRNVLPRVTARIFGEPLAIESRKLEIIVNAVGPRLRGASVDDDDDDYPAVGRDYQVTNGIAVIDICGTLVSRVSGMQALSGLASYQDIQSQLSAALTDQTVSGIVFCIASPGGEVDGMFELADAIYNARGQKPMCAIASCACSAAYLIASAADRVIISRIGLAGSIGVICLHLDESQADAQAGLKYTAVYAGARKNDGNPHEPLSEDALASLQSRVDKVYGFLTQAVARNRNIQIADVVGTQAAVYTGTDAVQAGLADEVGTEDSALMLVSRAIASGSRSIQSSSAAPAANSSKEHSMKTPPAAETTLSESDLEKLKTEAQASGYASAAEVADLCVIAGKPELIAGFVRDKKPTSEVRKTLIDMKAKTQEGQELIPGLMPGADTGAGKPQGKAKPWREVLGALGFAKKGAA